MPYSKIFPAGFWQQERKLRYDLEGFVRGGEFDLLPLGLCSAGLVSYSLLDQFFLDVGPLFI